jgi:hypothetical protein
MYDSDLLGVAAACFFVIYSMIILTTTFDGKRKGCRRRRRLKTLIVRVHGDGFAVGQARVPEKDLSTAYTFMGVCDEHTLQCLTCNASTKHNAETLGDVVATSLYHVTSEQFSKWPHPTYTTDRVIFIGTDATAYHVGVRMRQHWPNVAFSYTRI